MPMTTLVTWRKRLVHFAGPALVLRLLHVMGCGAQAAAAEFTDAYLAGDVVMVAAKDLLQVVSETGILGGELRLDTTTRELIFRKGGVTVTCRIGAKQARLDRDPYDVDRAPGPGQVTLVAPPTIRAGRAYVPLADYVKCLGLDLIELTREEAIVSAGFNAVKARFIPPLVYVPGGVRRAKTGAASASPSSGQLDVLVLSGPGLVYRGNEEVPSRTMVSQAPDARPNVLLTAEGAAFRSYVQLELSAIAIAMSGNILHPPLLPIPETLPGTQGLFNETGAIVIQSLNAISGAEHIYVGRVEPGLGYVFDSDPAYPLTFRVMRLQGYVYLCGRGTVTAPDGTQYRLGYRDSVEAWAGVIHSGDFLRAEGAAQALGYLAKTPEEKRTAMVALVSMARHPVMQVRRNAIEALGRLGAVEARQDVERALNDESEWVQAVAREVLTKLR